MPGLIESLKKLISSSDFCNRNKTKPAAFTRSRQLTFHRLIYFLLNMNNNAYQVELDRFFKTLFNHDFPKRIIYKSNITKARKNLDFEAFRELNDHMVNTFYSEFQHKTWHGLNLLAIDGSIIRLPQEDCIKEHFGGWKTNYGASLCAVARCSQMFDVLNKVTVDAIIEPKSNGERELAAYHLLKLQPKDMLLLDMGYPAHWFFNAILTSGAQFCARICPERMSVVKRFVESGKSEDIVQLSPSRTSKAKCLEMGLDTEPITVRLIRVKLESCVEVLVTSLTDRRQFPVTLFKDLYSKRWPVEEDYKTLKFRLEVENFSGKTVHSVYQDFHAKVFSKNLTAVIATTVTKPIEQKSKGLRYKHQLNFAQALTKMKDTIVALFNSDLQKVLNYLKNLQKVFIQTTEEVRPNRKYPRIHQIRRPRFFVAYKTTC